MREKLNARSVDELFEIANAMDRGEDPAEYLEKKKAAEEAAAKKAAEEKEAARKAAEEEKEAARKAAAEKAASGDSASEKTAGKESGGTLRKIFGGRFAFGNRGKEETPKEEEPETSVEGVTERRYGAGSVSKEAETVGNRILRSLHMEHLEEAPSEEAVEELVKGISQQENTPEEESSEEVSGKEASGEETPKENTKEEEISEELTEGTGEVNSEDSGEEENAAESSGEENKAEHSEKENEAESSGEENKAEDSGEENKAENSGEENKAENSGEEDKSESSGKENEEENPGTEDAEDNEEDFWKEETEEDDEDFWKNLDGDDKEDETAVEEDREGQRNGRPPMAVLAVIAGVIILLMVILGIASVTSSRPNRSSEPEQEGQMADEDAEPPAVTARKEDGEIALTAEDSGSGVASIWYAVVYDNAYLSLPQYQRYVTPISYEQGCTYYFYAVDQAGNRSAPLVTSMKSAVYLAADSGETTVSISAIGDCTLGTDRYAASSYSFDSYYTMNGASYFFENVRGILEEDDITFANLEGPLTTSDAYVEKEYIFKGDPSYTEILTDGSVEAVTLANNHSLDYGEQGLADTEEALDQAEIAYCNGSKIAYMDVSGVTVAFIGIYEPYFGEEYEVQVRETIEEAQKEGASLIIVAFHWGTESATSPDEGQRELAHTAIDCGADLVVGHHPHVLQGIEKYNGKYIVYSLANFCFGGNSAPSDQDTMIFRQTFTITDGEVAEDDDIEVIPCRVSSDSGYNDYRPTPAEGEDADEILGRIREYSEALEESL